MGFLYPRVNVQLTMAVSLAIASCLTAYVPYTTSAAVLLPVICVAQVPLGMFEAAANMFLLHLWGKSVTPFMQGLHFAYGIGAIVAPLIAERFLAREDDEGVNLFVPYTIVAGYILLNALAFAVVWHIAPDTTAHPSREDAAAAEEASQGTRKLSRGWKTVVVILCTIFAHLYMGMELSLGSYLPTFAVTSRLQLTKATGAHLVTLFWSAFTFTRILAIFLTERIGLEAIISGSLGLMLAASVMMTGFAEASSYVLWTGVAVFGVGISSIWASLFGFLEQQFAVSPRVSGLLVVAGILGEFVFPAIISSRIEANPFVLMIVVCVCCVTVCLIFAAVALIVRFKLRVSHT